MIILILGLLALFLLPHPWNEVAFAAAFGWEIATVLFLLWYSQRGRARVGSETLIGQSALVISACFPTGQVKLGGETWIARCEAGATVGQEVRVRAVNGLTLIVELDEASYPRFGLRPKRRAKLIVQPQPNTLGTNSFGSSGFHSRERIRSRVGRRQS